MRKGLLLLAVLVLGGAAIAYATVKSDDMVSGTWRYRTTVTIETPEGIKTGSAVREVNEYWFPKDEDIFSPGAAERMIAESKRRIDRRKPSLIGEAVVVDLGPRGVVFALMKGGRRNEDYAKTLPYEVFPFSGPGHTPESIRYYDTLTDARAVLSPEDYPVFVTFRDMKDPKGVEMVWQGEFYDERVGRAARRAFRVGTDRFEELFGKGVKLKEITVEMTEEPVTWEIGEWLPWLPKVGGGYLDGRFSGGGPELSNVLHGGNFKGGDTL